MSKKTMLLTSDDKAFLQYLCESEGELSYREMKDNCDDHELVVSARERNRKAWELHKRVSEEL